MLVKPISTQEVEEAMNHMDLGKCQDQMVSQQFFFHFFWDVIKQEVLEIVEESQRNRGVLKAFNATFLTLVLKGEGADTPSKFRPIALCNVI